MTPRPMAETQYLMPESLGADLATYLATHPWGDVAHLMDRLRALVPAPEAPADQPPAPPVGAGGEAGAPGDPGAPGTIEALPTEPQEKTPEGQRGKKRRRGVRKAVAPSKAHG